MCGLCGEIRFDGAPVDLGAVDRMTNAMAPRGPDSSGTMARASWALGHRRLSIIDLSARGAQPMVDSDLGLALAFNGCIYNHQQLRSTLQQAGYRFFSDADSEVIIKAFHHWGERFVERLTGMFAFALVDLHSGRAVLGRDRLGIKPLYIDAQPSRLRFASSTKALLDAGGVDTTIDVDALHQYLSFHSVVPAPRTIYAGVRKLPPATLRVIEPDGSTRDTRYWEPQFTRAQQYAGWSERDWQESLLDSLRQAVQRRMLADVPVGVLLSGGFDSSLVVALLAELGQQDLATFSIGFDSAGGESGDEYDYSDIVAAEFSTSHHKIHIDTSRLTPAVPSTVAAMNEPMVSHDCVAFYLLSQEVSQHVKVVQSGQGADEILAGYSWYPPLLDVPREQTTEVYRRVFFDRSHEAVNSLLNPDFRRADDPAWGFASDHQSRPGADTALDAALRLDTEVMLVDDPVKRVDSMTMAWGLEARVPFLDHDFVELAAACPPRLKLSDGGKGVLKRAGRPLLPNAIIDRTKGYFPVPGIRHLDGAMLEMVGDALTSRQAKDRGLYDAAAVQELLREPNTHRTTLDSNELWQIALLEMWLQTMAS